MTDAAPSLEDGEAAAARVLAARFTDLGSLMQDTYRLLGRALTNNPSVELSKVPLSTRVCSVILTRLGCDLRAAYLIATGGYPLAVMSLAASTYDIAFQVGYIGANDGRATAWAENGNPLQPIISAYDQSLEVFRQWGHMADEATALAVKERDTYHVLCGPKHGNSYYQRNFGYHVIESEHITEFRIELGPDSRDRALGVTIYALYHMLRWCLLAASEYGEAHAPAADLSDFRATKLALAERNEQLRATANAEIGSN